MKNLNFSHCCAFARSLFIFNLKAFFISLIIVLNTSNAFAIDPILNTTWGCRVGNFVYYDYTGINYTLGGNTYYQFTILGRSTYWPNNSDPSFPCVYFSAEGSHKCYVITSLIESVGTRGVFRENMTLCPIDNNFALLLITSATGLLLYKRKSSIHVK